MKKMLCLFLLLMPYTVHPYYVGSQAPTAAEQAVVILPDPSAEAVEEKIRNAIRVKADQLLISELEKPPIKLSNIPHVDSILDHFNAIQANFLTEAYKKKVNEIIQKALLDQRNNNYMAVLDEQEFQIMMDQRVKKGLEAFIYHTILVLEEIRERGTAAPRALTLVPSPLGLEEQIQRLRDETRIRRMIEKKGEEIMLKAVRQPPTSLGNIHTIAHLIDHFNALQAYHLTNEYLAIVEKISKMAVLDYLEKDFLRIIDDDTFEELMHKRIEYGLKEFIPKVIDDLEAIRETGTATSDETLAATP